jgi:hypothetical protein
MSETALGWGGLKHAAAGRALESVDPALVATSGHGRARVRDLVGKPPTNGSEILSYQPGEAAWWLVRKGAGDGCLTTSGSLAIRIHSVSVFPCHVALLSVFRARS